MFRHRSSCNDSYVRPKNRAKARFLQDGCGFPKGEALWKCEEKGWGYREDGHCNGDLIRQSDVCPSQVLPCVKTCINKLYTFAIWQTWDGGREVNGCKSSFTAVHSLKQIKDKRIDGMIKSIYY